MEGQPFVLDKRCERSFQELKERLTSTPMLVILEALGSFEVDFYTPFYCTICCFFFKKKKHIPRRFYRQDRRRTCTFLRWSYLANRSSIRTISYDGRRQQNTVTILRRSLGDNRRRTRLCQRRCCIMTVVVLTPSLTTVVRNKTP